MLRGVVQNVYLVLMSSGMALRMQNGCKRFYQNLKNTPNNRVVSSLGVKTLAGANLKPGLNNFQEEPSQAYQVCSRHPFFAV